MLVPSPRPDISPIFASANRGVILTMGDYYGTLAAARSLGRIGLSVVLAESRTWTTTRFSRHVSQSLKCPAMDRHTEFISWLLDLDGAYTGLGMAAG